MRISKVYDVLAPVYGRVVPGLYELATSRAAQRLSAGAPATILEVGVGPGHILSAVSRRNKSAMVVGIDISRGMLNQSRRRLKKRNVEAKLVLGEAVQLPFRDGSFEGVVTSYLLDLFRQEQIPDALREMCRVLAPGGRIVVATLQFSSPILRQLGLLAHRFLPGVVKRIQRVDFREFLEGTGLRVLKDEQIPAAAGTRLLTLVKVVG
ncbi:MAG: class I SAM-dependent methyltransferase [Gemmatimonadales bacterium]|jgi:ubiquinone/menaquinone biosynthesis C-methylase UbiE|nr:methyltransferase domain-containing protein [Nitrospirota bacterium]